MKRWSLRGKVSALASGTWGVILESVGDLLESIIDSLP